MVTKHWSKVITIVAILAGVGVLMLPSRIIFGAGAIHSASLFLIGFLAAFGSVRFITAKNNLDYAASVVSIVLAFYIAFTLIMK